MALFLFASSAGCSTLEYYSQSIAGQFELIEKRRSIQAVIDDPSTDAVVRNRLRLIRELADFAHQHLMLPDNGSYTTYSDLGRSHVVWNVFAAPALSMEPVKSCFIFVGCLSYRGFFSKQNAEEYADEAARQGYDTFTGGVSAYSTLGWFADPVLNTMLDRTESGLARLIFHELSHQLVYFRDDTEFNEAFAEAVAIIGVRIWSRRRTEFNMAAFVAEQEAERHFTHLILEFRNRLAHLYESAATDAEKLARKEEILEDLKRAYGELRDAGRISPDYDAWMRRGVNNAKILSVSTYRQLVPGFLDLYESTGDSLEAFYARVQALKPCPRGQRRQLLNRPDTNGGCEAPIP